jgi:outer membrane protein OmpA-like peptidoglycan-associated protein
MALAKAYLAARKCRLNPAWPGGRSYDSSGGTMTSNRISSDAKRARRSGLKSLTAAVLITAGALSAAPVFAESPGSVEVGVFGGYDLKHETNELGNAKMREEVPQAAAGLGARFGFALIERLSLEFEAKYIFSALKKSGDSAPVLGLRGSALFNLLTEGAVRPFLRLGGGSEILMTSSKNVVDGTDPDSATVFGVGSRFALSDDLGVRVDLLGLSVPGRNDTIVMEAEAWLVVYYTLGAIPKDTDGDGIIDKTDKCLTEKEDKDGWQDTDGCPDPDNDGDGILDGDDKCVDQAEVKNGLKDEDGCPDGDKDGDKIEDGDDKCPDKAENVNGFEDSDGCPDDPDTDKDGIVDSKDKCPKEPETKNGFEDTDGCPDKEPDTDKDGFVDSKDKCPKEPENVNSYQDDDGCPDVIPEKLKKFSGAIKGIEFETGSAKILPKSFAILDGAVKVLVEFKDTKIEVQGHTDNVGADDLNKKLSLDRAESVKKYFVDKGIAVERISTTGFGPDVPVADNKDPKGRAKNRRIEFKLL